MTLTMLNDMGELSRLVRELIQSVTLYRDGEGAMVIRVESWLGPSCNAQKGLPKPLATWGLKRW